MMIRKRFALVIVMFVGVGALYANGARSGTFFPFFDQLIGTTDAATSVPVPIIEKTLTLVQSNYYDQARVDPEEILKSAMVAIGQRISTFLAVLSPKEHVLSVTIRAETRTYSYQGLSKLSDLVPIFRDVFGWIVHSGVLDSEHLKQADIEYAVGDKILSTLDPHSNVLSPEVFEEFRTQTEGEFGGVGLVVGMRDALLTVVAPLLGTPASRSGIEAGDRIVTIDNEPSLNMALNEAVDKLRGRVGTKVVLKVDRDGRGEFQVTLVREVIQIESVQSTLMEENGKHIGYLRIKAFQGDTYNEVVKHLQSLKSRVPSATLDALVLDMRNNPGGLLEQAVDIADLFLTQGPIVMTVGPGATIEEVRMAKAPGTEPNYPMLVIANGGSASAAEIVSAALQDNHRALVVGEQSFGKGSVQTLFDLANDAALKLTISEYWTAGKRSIQSVGITPDIRLFPMKVSKKWMDLIPNERFGEGDLEKHLETTHNKTKEPALSLSYLDEKFFEDGLSGALSHDDDDALAGKKASEQAKKEYAKEADVSDDFMAQFSKKLLSSQTPEAFALLLKNDGVLTLSQWIQTAQKTENQKLVAALNQLGINWQSSPAQTVAEKQPPEKPLKPLIRLDTRLLQNGKEVTALVPGQEATIEVRATNTGVMPIDRVLASTESLYRRFLFDDREFVFGRLNPGESAIAQTALKLPPSLPPYQEPLEYVLYRDLTQKIDRSEASITVGQLPEPQFAFSYTLAEQSLIKEQSSEPLHHNQSVDLGELITLTVHVKNQGKGKADDVQVNLRNLNGTSVSLEKGRAMMGPMAPGEEKTAQLSFRVLSVPTDKKVGFDFFISDIKRELGLSTRLAFPMGTLSGLALKPATWYRPPQLTVTEIKSGPHTGSTSPFEMRENDMRTFRITGTVSDDDGLSDLEVYVGDDKQILNMLPKDHPTMPFTAVLTVNPKDKARFFFVTVRDKNGLATREAYGVPLVVSAPKSIKALLQ